MFFKYLFFAIIFFFTINCPSPGQKIAEKRCEKELEESLLLMLLSLTPETENNLKNSSGDLYILLKYSYDSCMEFAKQKGFYPKL